MVFSNLKRVKGWPEGYSYQPETLYIYYRTRVRGRPVKFSTGVKTLEKGGELKVPKEAKEFVENRMIELLSDNPSRERREQRGVKNHRISDVWKECVDERAPKKGPRTLLNYDVSWRKGGISDFWGHLHVSEINEQKVRKFENYYLQNFPKRTFFNTGKHLRMLFNYCVSAGYIAKAPVVTDLDPIIRTKTKAKKVGRVYTDQEIASLILAADLRTRLGILMSRYMGMRKMEVLQSKTENLNTKEWILSVWSDKNKKWRKVPISEVVQPTFKEYLNKLGKRSLHIFPAPKKAETHSSSQVFDKSWTKAKKKAGISNWNVKNAARFHDLRHTFATQTAVDNWPPTVACEVLDMSLKEYQRTYVHISDRDVRSMMKASFGGAK